MKALKVMYHNSPNFGDYISKLIVEKLSGRLVEVVPENNYKKDHYVVRLYQKLAELYKP